MNPISKMPAFLDFHSLGGYTEDDFKRLKMNLEMNLELRSSIFFTTRSQV